MDLIHTLIDFVLHLDAHLTTLLASVGIWFYVVLFAIIFAETGLVVMPFLPGDSLLFAVGALASLQDSPLQLPLLALTCFVAALLGDLTNYTVGKNFGAKLFNNNTAKILNRRYLDQTEAFYRKHGGKTIIIARFVPIIRTFAPFVAGVGQMRFARFLSFSLIGAGLWIVPFLSLGFIFGNNPVIKSNFHYVVVAIILLSVTPAMIQILKARRATRLVTETAQR
ncbi:MAG: DedA family protein [Deltaproteobacteria bacterium]|nr:DedA family protein [Deltaproteobacteria bacterium]